MGKALNDSKEFTEFLFQLCLQLGVFHHGKRKALVTQYLNLVPATHSSLLDVALTILIPLLTEEEIKP